jgi:polyphosphate kinase 2 (PPK2 family)
MAKNSTKKASPKKPIRTLPQAVRKIRLDHLKPLPAQNEVTLERRLVEQQAELTKIQHAYLFNRERAVIVFEGVDAAGKGGTIRRMAWALDPRSLHVWPISSPNEIEKQQHYLQRFWQKLPAKSQLAVFDRSWYGRVLVERVEGFASKPEWKRAYGEINEFERQLTDSGIRIVKLFLHVSKDEQLRRFEARLRDPLKRWKLSYEDFRNREKWDDYISAIEDMFDRTNTTTAPWFVIPSDDKEAARVEALRIIVERLSAGIDIDATPIDPKIVELAREVLTNTAAKAGRKKTAKS